MPQLPDKKTVTVDLKSPINETSILLIGFMFIYNPDWFFDQYSVGEKQLRFAVPNTSEDEVIKERINQFIRVLVSELILE